MKNKKTWVILIYVLFLVTLSVIFATILLNNNSYLFNIDNYFNTELKLISNIDKEWKILVDINRELNLNWSWYIDNISCPSWTTISMSWTTNTNTIWSVLTNSWLIYCLSTYDSKPLKLFFNTWITDFINAEYDGFTVSVTAWLWDATFSDSDNTLIDFSSYNYSIWDLYDDNLNSDNYMVTSTWNTSTWTYYLDSFQDDDVLWRKNIFWYVDFEDWFKEVFWNTTKSLDIIEKNTNNNDSLNIKIWEVNNWVLYFDVDKDYDIQLFIFDKVKYDNTNELVLLSMFKKTSSLSWTGYLEKDLTLAPIIDPSTTYSFNFQNNLYAIFLKSITEDTLLYKINGLERTSLKWIYITPIDDSDSNIIKYLWNDIIIDEKWMFIAKEVEKIYKK